MVPNENMGSNKVKEGEPLYQNQKVKNYVREKCYIESHVVNIVQSVLCCLEEHYSSILFDICHLLNCIAWPQLTIKSKCVNLFSIQLRSLHLHNRLKKWMFLSHLKLTILMKVFCKLQWHTQKDFHTSKPVWDPKFKHPKKEIYLYLQ